LDLKNRDRKGSRKFQEKVSPRSSRIWPIKILDEKSTKFTEQNRETKKHIAPLQRKYSFLKKGRGQFEESVGMISASRNIGQVYRRKSKEITTEQKT